MISRVYSSIANYIGSFSQRTDCSQPSSGKRRWNADDQDQCQADAVLVKRMRSSILSAPVPEAACSTSAPSIEKNLSSGGAYSDSLFGSLFGRKMAFLFRPATGVASRVVDQDSESSEEDVKVIGEVAGTATSDVVVDNRTGGNDTAQTGHRHTPIGKRIFEQSAAGQRSRAGRRQLAPSGGAVSYSTVAGADSVCLSPGRRANTHRSYMSSAMGRLHNSAHHSRSLVARKFSKLNCYRLSEKSLYRQLLEQHLTSTATSSRAPPAVEFSRRSSSDDVVVLETRGYNRDVSQLPRPVSPPSRQESLHSTVAPPAGSSISRLQSQPSSAREDTTWRHRPSPIVNGHGNSNSKLRAASIKHGVDPPQRGRPPPSGEDVETGSDCSASTVVISDSAVPSSSASTGVITLDSDSAPSGGDPVASEFQLAVSRRLDSYDAACARNRQARELLHRQIADEEAMTISHQRTQLEWEQRLSARLRRQARITPAVAVEAESELSEEEEEEKLVQLTDDMQERVNAALRPKPDTEVLCEAFNQRITRHDIQTLNGLNWLNDEIVNFYMTMVVERSKSDNSESTSRRRFLRVYAFNTFFYGKIVGQGHSAVRRWTRKVDIFSHELLIVPVHLGMHWCLMGVDLRHNRITFYDSMGSDNQRALKAMLRYLADEHRDKKSTDLDTSPWTTVTAQDIPQQMNGSDCGMFACKFAEYLSRDAPFSFSQDDMPYFRRRMVYEIITKTLL